MTNPAREERETIIIIIIFVLLYIAIFISTVIGVCVCVCVMCERVETQNHRPVRK